MASGHTTLQSHEFVPNDCVLGDIGNNSLNRSIAQLRGDVYVVDGDGVEAWLSSGHPEDGNPRPPTLKHQCVTILGRNLTTERDESQGSVCRACVNEEVAQAASYAGTNRGLPDTRWPIDGDLLYTRHAGTRSRWIRREPCRSTVRVPLAIPLDGKLIAAITSRVAAS